MSIYLRGKSWYFDFIHKGQRYTGSFGHVSRTVAKEELARKKAEVVEGRLNPAKTRKSPPFAVFAEEYLDWIKTNRKPLTHLKFTSVASRLTAFFGQKRLNELTPWHLEQYKKARKEAGKQPSTINVELAILKAMLRKAQQWGKLADLQMNDMKPLKGVQGKTRFLSEAEAAAILAACSPALRRVVAVGLLTGFRRQELASLRPEDVDLTRGSVSVAACYSKNGESRTLPLSPGLRALLEQTDFQTRTVVFTTEEGKPWTPGALGDAFRHACHRAAVGSLGPHVLRHTFASRLVMAGVDLETVKKRGRQERNR